ncbi:hypothetical protein [Paenibacillus campi]|uniref:hypothetical protein n=1 Tax=Paenibacillus campi TaxID=3106031 RepID=UPI002B000AB5|nr:hypothetical protein [Paenibacillus sp. SGZ-1009]
MSTNYFKGHWNEDGSVASEAPNWLRNRMDMKRAFPSPFQAGQIDPLAIEAALAIRKLDALKQSAGGPAYLGDTPSVQPDYDHVQQAELAPHMESVSQVVEEAVNLFKGLPNWNHPLTMPNVIPPSNIASALAAMLTEVFSPNLIEGEYSWNVEVSELEAAVIVAKLIGWYNKDHTPKEGIKPGGLFTFGGSGCYLYGLKYALTRVLGKNCRFEGIRTDAKLLVSQQGHYCKLNSTDWSGLGMNNIVQIQTNESNCMDLHDLEAQMKQLHEQQIPIASIVCTIGSTDAYGTDDVAAVRQLIEKYPNPDGYGKTFLYCDAVIGWSWLTFNNYDFAANPLGFSTAILPIIQSNYNFAKQMIHADAIGCDFHKVGWSPYNCSLFMIRDYKEFVDLMNRPPSKYLQERTSYNPGLYTLEASRSGAYSMAGWATLKFFGHEGFQSILGSTLEMEFYLRKKMLELSAIDPSILCVNAEDHGFVTLFRVYPKGVHAREQYNRELTDPQYREKLIENNKFQAQIADKLWNWFRSGELHHGSYAPYISYTSGFRPTTYNKNMQDEEAVIFALKAFPMNVNIDAKSMDTVIEQVLAARDEL